MDRMRKIKRQLSLTLRGGNSGDKTLSETISSQDTGAHSDSGTHANVFMRVVVSVNAEIVHEDVKMGSDGESDQASATSSEEVHSPVRVRLRNNPGRKISTEDINKRLSLPADIRLPDGYLEKFSLNSPLFEKPLSRRLRRVSL
ncbi:hypothetical protein cypCar_00047869, partial [Cyprinus carpio]